MSTKEPPFYGWIVVTALSVAGGITMSLGIGNFGVFVAPMSADLDAGSTPFGLGLTVRLLGFAASGAIVGKLLDRYGARGPLSLAIVLFGASVVAMGYVQSSWQMVALLLVMGLLGFWGSSSLYFSVMASQWFIRRRGKAMSIMFVGFPLGIAVSAPLSDALIAAFGWRAAWQILGISAAAAVLLITRLVLRNRPEDMGLLPDGAPHPVEGQPAQVRQSEHSWTLHAALRTGAFWRLAIAFGTVMMGMSAIGLFWVPYFVSLDFAPGTAAWALSTYAVSQAAMSVLLAPMVDRFQPRFLGLFGFASFIAGYVLMINAAAVWQMFLTAVLAGAGVGSGMLLQAHMWPSYFGRLNIGAIRGAAFPLTLAFSGAGSLATGVVFDATGSYAPAWIAVTGALAMGSVLLAVTPKPRRLGQAGAAEGEGT